MTDGPRYEFKSEYIEADEVMDILRTDGFFNKCLLSTDVSTKHLTAMGSALSDDKGAVNCTTDVCNKLMKWLTGSRKGDWECTGISDKTCKRQHYCQGGRDCDTDGCQLVYPQQELRWVVHQWAEAMTFDEAIHDDGNSMEKTLARALAADEKGCTSADVWQASTAALAYGRKEIPAARPVAKSPTASVPVPATAPAPAKQEKPPAPVTAAPATHDAALGDTPAAVAVQPAALAVKTKRGTDEGIQEEAPPSAYSCSRTIL